MKYKFFLKKISSLLGFLRFCDVKVFYITFLSLIVAFFEIFAIGSIVYFLNIVSGKVDISNIDYFSLINLSGFNHDEILIFSAILLLLIFILKAFFNVYFNYKLASTSRMGFYKIADALLKNFLSRSNVDYHKITNSSLSKLIITEGQGVTTAILGFLTIIAEAVVLLFLLVMLAYENLHITLAAIFSVFIIALLLYITVTSSIKKQGLSRENSQKQMFGIINQAYGNFKMIKFFPDEKSFIDLFNKSNHLFAKSLIRFETLIHIPKITIELLGFSLILISSILLLYNNPSNKVEILQTLTVFVLGFYRILPAINRIVSAINRISFNAKSIDLVKYNLDYRFEKSKGKKFDFKKNIVFRDISFSYSSKVVLNDIYLDINLGDRIGIFGKSGAGKSSLLDIISGLNKPQKGNIFIDSKQFGFSEYTGIRNIIGYIPQNVYLFNGTIAENVAFGRKIDKLMVINALRKAKFYESNEHNLDFIINDYGNNLSGGQRQRIGIARALYANPKILILDESTASLDDKTQELILKEISNLPKNIAVISVSHNLKSLSFCNKIFKLEKGKIQQIDKSILI